MKRCGRTYSRFLRALALRAPQLGRTGSATQPPKRSCCQRMPAVKPALFSRQCRLECHTALGLTTENIHRIGQENAEAARVIQHTVYHCERLLGGCIAGCRVCLHARDLRYLREPTTGSFLCTLKGNGHENRVEYVTRYSLRPVTPQIPISINCTKLRLFCVRHRIVTQLSRDRTEEFFTPCNPIFVVRYLTGRTRELRFEQ